MHKCTRCGKVYEKGSKAVLKGCECGNRLFLYIRRVSDTEASELKSSGIAKEIKPDIWNIKVKNGIYDIDIASLMKNEPVIVAGDEGRYVLSLSSAFKGKKRTKK